MVDFSKLNTPEAKEEMKQRRLAREKIEKQKHEATKFMLNHLSDCEDLNDYENEFILSVSGRFNIGLPLSEKQEALLYKLFHNH
jgi:hypothetical protein